MMRVIVIAVGALLPVVFWWPSLPPADLIFQAILFMEVVHVIPIAAIWLVSYLYDRPVSILFPAIAGYGFLAFTYWDTLHPPSGQRISSTASLILLFAPLYALLPILIGAVIGYAVDKYLIRRGVTQ